MIENARFSKMIRLLIWLLPVVLFLVFIGWAVHEHAQVKPGDHEPLSMALHASKAKGTEQALVADAIWDNYRKARSNAKVWSGLLWACTFVAAALSAGSALILKVETNSMSEATKKNWAACLSVVATLLITISTSGDFQRLWHANRLAAAELERTGYRFLKNDDSDARTSLETVGQILHRRHLMVVGAEVQADSSYVVGNDSCLKK